MNWVGLGYILYDMAWTGAGFGAWKPALQCASELGMGWGLEMGVGIRVHIAGILLLLSFLVGGAWSKG